MKKLILFIPLLLLFSCATVLYQPITGTEKIPLEDLKKGRSIYVNNCSSCHNLHNPNQYNSKEWEHNLNEMQARAKINDEEKQLVYDYLVNAPMKK